jgi:hypothetical protein
LIKGWHELLFVMLVQWVTQTAYAPAPDQKKQSLVSGQNPKAIPGTAGFNRPVALNSKNFGQAHAPNSQCFAPFGTSGPTPGRPVSQYGGSTGAEEL